jgi:heat-inducible transcriptional repressor
MPSVGPIKGRHLEILTAIVREYIATGEPVGSRTISRQRSQTLSPASIRNAMADLADEGYLSQPHTSAGRIPTEKAFRYYVSSLTAAPMGAADSDRLRSEFSGLDTVGAHVERSCHILMELTRNVGIAAAIPALAQELDQIELVPLAEQRVLIILVTRDHMVRSLPRPTSSCRSAIT